MNIVWYKRDLRLNDHLPFLRAIESGQETILLYIYEPSMIADRHYSIRHWRFVQQSLNDLQEKLRIHGNSISIFYGEAIKIFEHLISEYPIKNVFSHIETGLKITYERDVKIKQFLDQNLIHWHEYDQNGVKRGLKNRQNWVNNWYDFMQQKIPVYNPHNIRTVKIKPKGDFLIPRKFKNKLQITNNEMQRGGSSYAWKYLTSFLKSRHKNYNKHISKPHLSFTSCSRLSPYLAWGNISVREVFQFATSFKSQSLYKPDLSSWKSRLRWHCHFIQKFEMEHQIEERPFNKGYQNLKYDLDPEIFNTWATGKTGFPMVDASMRCLIRKGYVNFRMRAMLVSFLCHLCNHSWLYASHWLSKLFLDFEPGIHYPQIQMQAGITGINTIRIYNPVKQGYENDKDGEFIKEFVPELKDVPVPLLFEPYKLTVSEQLMYNCQIGLDYPTPILELSKSYSAARKRLWEFRNSEQVRKDNNRIIKKHTVKNRKE